jgi:hypothetical protein
MQVACATIDGREESKSQGATSLLEALDIEVLQLY